MLPLLLIITVCLPAAWLAADLRGSARARRTLGVIALLWSFGVAAGVGFLQNLNANAYFTFASKKLLHESVQHLRDGKTEAVTQALSRADDKFQWTYENRGKYKEVVEQAIIDMDHPQGLTTRSSEQRLAVSSFLFIMSLLASLCR